MRRRPPSLPRLPTIRQRFLYALMWTGSCIALIATLVIGLTDAYALRRSMVENVLHYSEAMARVSAFNISNPGELNQHLHDFSGLPDLRHSCIFDAQGKLLASWHADGTPPRCPSLISQSGISETLFTLSIARTIGGEADKKYLGMIYVEGELQGLKGFLTKIAIAAAGLLTMLLLLCLIVSRRVAGSISRPLHDFERQVLLLASGRHGATDVTAAQMTQETSRLFQAIAQLRVDLMATMLPRGQVEAMRRWQDDRLDGLLALLRSRLPDDAALLPCIADYALLQHLGQIPMNYSERFELQRVADHALASVRRLYPCNPDLHLTLSLKSSMPRLWQGDSAVMEALLRNLLLIALRRTSSGMVCLRLEDGQSAAGGESILFFTLEDTGPEMHTGRINKLLQDAKEGVSDSSEPIEISWLATARIVDVLGGVIHRCESPGGLALRGWVRLSPLAGEEAAAEPAAYRQSPMEGAPLVMIVEDDRVNSEAQRGLLEKLGCLVLAVSNGAQALEWVPVLPVSMIILDQMLPDMTGVMVAKKLQAMMESHAIARVPLVALSSADTLQLRDAWAKIRMERVILKPLGFDTARSLRAAMPPMDTAFYAQHDNAVIRHLSPVLRPRANELRDMLQTQLAQYCDAMRRMQTGNDAAMQAHAVKSGALTLGYERLAACMDMIEHDLRHKGGAFVTANAQALLACLSASSLQNPAQLVALSS